MEEVTFLEKNVSLIEKYFEVSDGVQLKCFDFIPQGYHSLNMPVIVFIAGWISRVQGWADVLKFISGKYRTLYVETREKKSALLPDAPKHIDFSIERMSRDVDEILTRTLSGHQPFYFLGSSLGSTIILHYLSKNRKQSENSFLISPICEFPFPAWLLLAIRFFPAWLYAVIKPLIKWYLIYFHLDRHNEPEQVRKYQGTIDAAEPARLKANAYAIKDYTLWDKLESVPSPVTLIGAETDKLHGIDTLKEMITRLPQARLEMMQSNRETHSEKVGRLVVEKIGQG